MSPSPPSRDIPAAAQAAAIHGVWAPALTPMGPDLAIDAERFVAHARWLLEHGCHGVVLFGTTGEATSFAVEERMALLERVVDAGLPGARLMVGTGCCALPDSVRLTRHAVAHGCPAVLVLPPFYFKGVTDEGLFRSYAEIIERVAAPELALYLYHFPRLSGVPITPALVAHLCEVYPRNVAGLKDSSGDWAGTRGFIERFPQLAILPGSETLLHDALRLGGAGCITATANINPTAIRRAYDACRVGAEAAPDLQATITVTRGLVEPHPLAPALKAVLAHYRGDPAWRPVRPPLVSFPETEAEALVAALEHEGYAFPDPAAIID